uniref:Translation initiation factor 3 N-terminal domain-containing protein n=1 Tax=Eptatretus burgeri TaxID=7764 RepID=A0A8C4QZU9_EPTBU
MSLSPRCINGCISLKYLIFTLKLFKHSPPPPQPPPPPRTQGPLRNKKKNVRDPFTSVGRVIDAPIVELQDTNGKSLGHMSRAEALGRTGKLYLRLVVINERRDPPIYRMMSSQDILAIQMDKRAKDKANPKTGIFCTKELRFTSLTEKSHLGVKQNQVVRWLQKGPCHIRITITRGNKSTSVEDMVCSFHQWFVHKEETQLRGSMVGGIG